jgi:pimeloyl-ACP methyl ester carboxylesterase
VITCLHHNAASGKDDRVLLVMLPGAGMGVGEFAEHGIVAAVQEPGLAIDIVATCPALDLYLDGTIAKALHSSIVEPALAQGYRRFWFLGISLGGLGALLYTSTHATQVDGLVLLAPFLGVQGTVAEIAKAGSLAAWSPVRSSVTKTEWQFLVWLQGFLEKQAAYPALYLGYGRRDRFAQGHRMLAEQLPRHRVVTIDGGHDWDTWLTLWRRLLGAIPFAMKAATADDTSTGLN